MRAKQKYATAIRAFADSPAVSFCALTLNPHREQGPAARWWTAGRLTAVSRPGLRFIQRFQITRKNVSQLKTVGISHRCLAARNEINSQSGL